MCIITRLDLQENKMNLLSQQDRKRGFSRDTGYLPGDMFPRGRIHAEESDIASDVSQFTGRERGIRDRINMQETI